MWVMYVRNKIVECFELQNGDINDKSPITYSKEGFLYQIEIEAKAKLGSDIIFIGVTADNPSLFF